MSEECYEEDEDYVDVHIQEMVRILNADITAPEAYVQITREMNRFVAAYHADEAEWEEINNELMDWMRRFDPAGEHRDIDDLFPDIPRNKKH